ncbi:uncharacterized protein STEHIDRAFT_161052 [Stereum hirsutum FP-91666 SS1]|uniref:uncharacterized protein n=1 Tax=Stereum hirsutum (strain FP-91666) TaxID=721885 RepID=UPI00044492B4|nr:uncharacterized protein STEHIDRAFT_161052 [Stereum hirsutum FP-91666 SS1]EIM82514.1 hypothetical protein STEHIDRAFT_161052 [Stereum hirsutum FP-91666 SS1]
MFNFSVPWASHWTLPMDIPRSLTVLDAVDVGVVDVALSSPTSSPTSSTTTSPTLLLLSIIAVVAVVDDPPTCSIIAVVAVVDDPPTCRYMHLSSDQVRFLFGMVVRVLVYIGLVALSFHLFFVPHLAYLPSPSFIVPSLSTLFHHRPYLPSSTFVYLHPPSSTFTHLRLPSPTFVYLHPPSSTFTHLRLPSPILTDLRLSSSTLTYTHQPSPILVHTHPTLALTHPYPHLPSPSYSVWAQYLFGGKPTDARKEFCSTRNAFITLTSSSVALQYLFGGKPTDAHKACQVVFSLKGAQYLLGGKLTDARKSSGVRHETQDFHEEYILIVFLQLCDCVNVKERRRPAFNSSALYTTSTPRSNELEDRSPGIASTLSWSRGSVPRSPILRGKPTDATNSFIFLQVSGLRLGWLGLGDIDLDLTTELKHDIDIAHDRAQARLRPSSRPSSSTISTSLTTEIKHDIDTELQRASRPVPWDSVDLVVVQGLYTTPTSLTTELKHDLNLDLTNELKHDIDTELQRASRPVPWYSVDLAVVQGLSTSESDPLREANRRLLTVLFQVRRCGKLKTADAPIATIEHGGEFGRRLPSSTTSTPSGGVWGILGCVSRSVVSLGLLSFFATVLGLVLLELGDIDIDLRPSSSTTATSLTTELKHDIDVDLTSEIKHDSDTELQRASRTVPWDSVDLVVVRGLSTSSEGSQQTLGRRVGLCNVLASLNIISRYDSPQQPQDPLGRALTLSRSGGLVPPRREANRRSQGSGCGSVFFKGVVFDTKLIDAREGHVLIYRFTPNAKLPDVTSNEYKHVCVCVCSRECGKLKTIDALITNTPARPRVWSTTLIKHDVNTGRRDLGNFELGLWAAGSRGISRLLGWGWAGLRWATSTSTSRPRSSTTPRTGSSTTPTSLTTELKHDIDIDLTSEIKHDSDTELQRASRSVPW